MKRVYLWTAVLVLAIAMLAPATGLAEMPAAEGEESGIVKQAYVKGYKKGEKVLRYAQVIVTQ